MNKHCFLLTLLLMAALTACSLSSADLAAEGANLNPTATESAAQATNPASQIQLSGTPLSVLTAQIGDCGEPGCPTNSGSFLLVTLQAQDLSSEQFLDYKNLPQEIAVVDETGTISAYSGIYSYAPDTQQLTLYFPVSPSASNFSLQWPGSAEVPLTVSASAIVVPQATPQSGVESAYGMVKMVLPAGVADGISGSEIPKADSPDAPWWERSSGYTLIDLGDSYILQGKTHRPQIYLYPVEDFKAIAPNAADSIQRLESILIDSRASIYPEELPVVPFFNAAQAFATQFKRLDFQNGLGVRFLTEYGQYPVSANNTDLFYEFQGISQGGAYYIVAIFPVTHPLLAETPAGDAPLPAGGIPYTYFNEGGNFNADSYYGAVMDLLDSASPDSFTPTLDQLDALIQSLEIGS